MDLEGIMLTEISQKEKDKYCMVSLMWNMKNFLNFSINEETKPNKNKHIDRENSMVTRGEGDLGEGEMGKGGQLYVDGWKINCWW